jgi:hypothetical protein
LTCFHPAKTTANDLFSSSKGLFLSSKNNSQWLVFIQQTQQPMACFYPAKITAK